MISLPAILETARDALMMVTPMKKDCGARCGAACCKPDADGQGGMILFPEEERFYLNCGWASITDSDIFLNEKPLHMLTCRGECERNNRPLSCRMFPLTPYVKEDQLQIILDVRAWPMCPLMSYGMSGLSLEFVEAVRNVAQMLYQNSECRAYIVELSKRLDAYRSF